MEKHHPLFGHMKNMIKLTKHGQLYALIPIQDLSLFAKYYPTNWFEAYRLSESLHWEYLGSLNRDLLALLLVIAEPKE